MDWINTCVTGRVILCNSGFSRTFGAGYAIEVEDAKRHLLALQQRHDPQQVSRGPRQPVEPGHDQGVALTHEVQRRIELAALRDRRCTPLQRAPRAAPPGPPPVQPSMSAHSR
jgi:hypothetical protein